MKRFQNIPLGFFASLLLIATVVAGENKSDTTNHSSSKYSIIKSSCSSTPYPELCFSTIANSSEITNKLTNQKEVIMASLNLTTTAVKQNLFHIEKLIKKKWLTKREKTALRDCLETIDQALDDLHKAEVELNEFPNKKPLFNHADDLKTFLSSAITNHQTCLDGLSHNEADTKLRKAFLGSHLHVEKMFSNALAMTKNMTDTDMAVEAMKNGRLREEGYRGWPEWLLAEERKLFLSPNVTPNVVVAADGSGDYRTVSAAVSAAPSESFWRYVIRIKAGVYRENVEVPKSKKNILFWGDGRKNTIITGDRNVQDGSTTFRSATVGVVGERFLARDITFQNTAGPSKHQAVALRVGSDFSAFYQCDILGYQDTLYVHSNHQFYVNCLVAGTVDFIFGNAAVVFQDCDIHARRPGSKQKNMVTAQGRTDKNQNTGIVIQKCRIDGTSDLKPVKSSFPTYLGRPWKEYSRTIIMESYISDVVDAAGWHEWTGDFALNTLEYREYQNNGSGAGTTGRVNWTGYKVITNAAEASQYAPGMFIQGGSWLNSTTFPFSLGL